MKETTETIILKNPFNSSHININKCFSENRLTREAVKLMLNTLDIEAENEFYVLFTTGVLIKKERSKFKTSDYFKGGKMTKIKEVYNGQV
jgi:hypothetical protein